MAEENDDKEILVVYGRVIENFGKNFLRLRSLLEIAQNHMIQTRTLDSGFDEILRAVVVFLHASLEDVLREIARLRLRNCSPEVLNDISLVGMNRGQKFSLGDLNKHRGKTIDILIQESIDQDLSKESFNSSSDIANILEKKLGIELSNVRKHFSNLDQMILRRHQIVHNADLENSSGSRNPASINIPDVERWIGTVLIFVLEIFPSITEFPDLQEQIRNLPEIREMLEIGHHVLKISNIPIDVLLALPLYVKI